MFFPIVSRRRLWAGLGVITFLACAAYLGLAPRTPAGPRAVVEPATQRIVALPKQAKSIARYAIRNAGSEDLILSNPTSSCGCSVPSVAPERVPPGGTATLTVEGTPMPAGVRDVLIQIQSNDPTQTSLAMRLTMVGSGAVPYVAYLADAVAFGVVASPHARQTCFVETREREGSAPWLGSPRVSLDDAAVTGGLREERPMGEGVRFRRYEFAVELIKLPKAGNFHGELAFAGPHEAGEPTLRIPVHGIVRPPVYAIPSTLYASCDRGGQPAPLTLRLVTNDQGAELRADYQADDARPLVVRRIAQQGPVATFEVASTVAVERTLATELVFQTNRAAEVRVPLVIAPTP